ncbi:MAG: diphthamide biosynthesis enzyme Dph2 [archaeon]
MAETNSRLKIDFDFAKKAIEKSGAKRIILQMPEGLKGHIILIIAELRENCKSAEFFCSIDPVYGACDLAEKEAEQINADLVLHFGHSQMIGSKKTVYVPVTYEISEKEIEKSAKKIIGYLQRNKISNVSLGGTIQYVPYLQKIKQLIEKQNIKVNLGRTGLLKDGQILGCNINSVLLDNKTQLLVLFSDGYFHAKFAALTSKKPVIQVDLINAKIEEIKQDQKLVRKRIAAIQQAEKAKSFGILICTKEGQFNIEKALELKKLIDDKGKTAYLFTGDFLMPEYFLGIDVDCFVSTACPRIVLDESEKWKKPLLNAEELMVVLGIKKLEEYSLI